MIMILFCYYDFLFFFSLSIFTVFTPSYAFFYFSVMLYILCYLGEWKKIYFQNYSPSIHSSTHPQSQSTLDLPLPDGTRGPGDGGHDYTTEETLIWTYVWTERTADDSVLLLPRNNFVMIEMRMRQWMWMWLRTGCCLEGDTKKDEWVREEDSSWYLDSMKRQQPDHILIPGISFLFSRI